MSCSNFSFSSFHLFSLSSAGNLYPGKRKMFVLGKVVCYPLYFQSNIRGKGRRGSEGRKRNLFKSVRLAMPSTSSTRRSGQPKWPPLSFNKQLMLTAIMVERVEKWKPLPDLFFSQNAKLITPLPSRPWAAWQSVLACISQTTCTQRTLQAR